MGFRILHSIASLNPALGGPIEGVKQMSIVNRRHGHTVEVVCLDDPLSPWLKSFPLRVHALGPGVSKYGYCSRLVPWLREHRAEFDAVIVNGIWQYSSFAVWRALRNTPTPYFVFTHGMLDPWFKRTYPFKHVKKWLYWPWGDFRVLRDATAVLFTCEEERRLARQSFWLYRCDEFVVGYGTGTPPGNGASQREAFLQRFEHLRDQRCLLFLGRMHVKKGPDLVLKAFAATLRDMPAARTERVHLVMAGPDDDTYAREMKSLAAELGLDGRVTWTGMLEGDLKWGAFHASEAFVLPSHQENFGIAVAEALACGLPVLISNQVNIWREVRQHGAGFVEMDDVPGTRRLLEAWLGAASEDWLAMRARARSCFAERFHIDRIADSFILAMELYGLIPRTAPGAALRATERVFDS